MAALLTAPQSIWVQNLGHQTPVTAQGVDHQGNQMTVYLPGGQAGSQAQSLDLASIVQGGDPAAGRKACLLEREDASCRPARLRGIYPETTGSLGPGHPILLGRAGVPPCTWHRGRGEQRGDVVLRSFCVQMHMCEVSQDSVGRATGPPSVVGRLAVPKAVHILIPEPVNMLLSGQRGTQVANFLPPKWEDDSRFSGGGVKCTHRGPLNGGGENQR